MIILVIVIAVLCLTLGAMFGFMLAAMCSASSYGEPEYTQTSHSYKQPKPDRDVTQILQKWIDGIAEQDEADRAWDNPEPFLPHESENLVGVPFDPDYQMGEMI